MLPEKPQCQSRMSLFSHRGRAVTMEEQGCGEKNERKKEGGGVLKPNVFFQV